MFALITAHRKRMQDLQGFQYYDPSPLPTPEPWWQRRRTWLTAGAVASFGVLAVFVTIGILNAVKNHTSSSGKSALAEVAAAELQFSSDCATDDQVCLERARADAARSVGAVQGCEQLTGERLFNCVALIARDQKDPEACKVLDGSAQQTCADTAWLLKAKADVSLDGCSQISDADNRATCQAQVKDLLITRGRCSEAQVEQEVCDENDQLHATIALGTPSACDALSSEEHKYICNYLIVSTDADADGLMLNDEVSGGLSDTIADGDDDGLNDGDEVHVYATNPTKSDTDGDGFSDGTEVASGYDPLK